MKWGSLAPARFLSERDTAVPGVRRVISIAQPSAGADWSQTVPGGRSWRVLGATANLTTSATVASRFPGWQATVAGALIYNYVGIGSLPASSSSAPCTWAPGPGSQSTATAFFVWVPVPDVWLPEQTKFGSLTSNLQVGDQWSAPSLWIEEGFFTDNQLTEFEVEREEYTLEEYEAYERAMAQAGTAGP